MLVVASASQPGAIASYNIFACRWIPCRKIANFAIVLEGDVLTSYSDALVSLSLLKVFVASMSSLIRRSSSFFLRLNLIRFLKWYFPSLLSLALRISFKSPDFAVEINQLQSSDHC